MNRHLRFILAIIALIALNGCYNNSHIRTQRVLEPGDRVFSGYTSANLLAADTHYRSYDIRHGGVPGMRAGLSYLGYHKGLEQGFTIAYGGGSGDYNANVLGYDVRKVISSASTPYRYGLHVELNLLGDHPYEGINGGSVVQIQPYLMSTTSPSREWYGGIHGIMSFGDIEASGSYWDYQTSYQTIDYDYTYSASAVGLGVTIGNEMQLGQLLIQTQVDLSYLTQDHSVDSEDYDAIFNGIGNVNSEVEIHPLKSSGPYATLGFAVGLAPESQKKRRSAPFSFQEKTYTPAQKFDPNTGEIISPQKRTPRFDPLTGKPITDSPPKYDPFTGLPVEQAKPATPKSLLTANERSLLLMNGLRVISLNNVATNAQVQDIKDNGLILYRESPGASVLETIAFENILSIEFEGGKKGVQKGFKAGMTACGTCIGLPLAASLITGEGELFGLGLLASPVIAAGSFLITSLSADKYLVSFTQNSGYPTDDEQKMEVLSHLIKVYIQSGFPEYDLTKIQQKP